MQKMKKTNFFISCFIFTFFLIGIVNGASAEITTTNVVAISGSSIDYDNTNARTMGNLDAPVEIVMYADFEDPFSARWHEGVFPDLKKDYIDTGIVKLTIKHYPLFFHQNAYRAHTYSQCAAFKNKFFEYIDILYDDQNALTDEDLFNYAEKLNIDSGIRECLVDSDTLDIIDADIETGKALVKGTPTFFVNDFMIAGAQPYNVFEDAIKNALGDSSVPYIRPVEVPINDVNIVPYVDSNNDRTVGLDTRFKLPAGGEIEIEGTGLELESDDYVDDCSERKSIIIRSASQDGEIKTSSATIIAKPLFDQDCKIMANIDVRQQNCKLSSNRACKDEYSLAIGQSVNVGEYRIVFMEMREDVGIFMVTENLDTIETDIRIVSSVPTCYDNIQNDGELGIDCGGPCISCTEVTYECINGCSMEGKCLPYGTRIVENNIGLYCNLESKLDNQLEEGDSCQNDYECVVNSCISGECLDIGKKLNANEDLLNKMLAWISGFFN